MSVLGLDYAWGGGQITPAAHRAIGSHFACRYLSSPEGNSKNLSVAEARMLHQGGIDIVLVWETVAKRAYSGYSGGWSDAAEATRQADNLARALGFTNWPVIYCAPFDDDAAESDQAAINAYLTGWGKYRGPNRAGTYLGFWPLKRAVEAKVPISHWWQTYGWSGGNWHPACHLRQFSNNHTVNGVGTDYDSAMQPEYGQLRQVSPQPQPKPQPDPKPQPKPLSRDQQVANRGFQWAWTETRSGPFHPLSAKDKQDILWGVQKGLGL